MLGYEKEQRNLTYHNSLMKDMIKRKCNELVNQAIKDGKDHLVIEDLKLFDKSFSKSEEFEAAHQKNRRTAFRVIQEGTLIKEIKNK
jgi:hypothetical protein